MPKGSLNVSLKGADDIFSTEESRQEQQREQVQQIPIGELFPFKNHPFKVLDDESMQRTVESVEQYGTPPKRWKSNGTPSLQGGGCLPSQERYHPTSMLSLSGSFVSSSLFPKA